MKPREHFSSSSAILACLGVSLGCSDGRRGVADGAGAGSQTSADAFDSVAVAPIDATNGPGEKPPSLPCVPGPNGCWVALATQGVPEARTSFAEVWTGKELLVWGGVRTSMEGELRTGGAYSVSSRSWRPMSFVDQLMPREGPCFVWTGRVMWNWCGYNSDGDVPPTSVSTYDPENDSWILPSTGGKQPLPRAYTKAVWTGTEVLVWGGIHEGETGLDSGGRYDIASSWWSATSTAGAPTPRWDHLALWTGSRMLVWGGQYGADTAQSGGAYDPVTDSWSPITSEGSVTAREPAGAWTGREMFVWGDTGPGMYDPQADHWHAVSMNGAPSPRSQPMVVWTGHFAIVWGGRSSGTLLADGGLYDVAADAWTSMSTQGAPKARTGPAVWADSEQAMLVWGGADFASTLNDGAAFYPPTGD